MSLYQWIPEFTVSVGQFDNEHKKLINLINSVNEAMRAGKTLNTMKSILNELSNYTTFHFANEEKMMQQYNYPDLEIQKHEHKRFIEKINAFKDDFEKKSTSGAPIGALTISMVNFLKEWLTNHILKLDKKYGAFFNSKGIR